MKRTLLFLTIVSLALSSITGTATSFAGNIIYEDDFESYEVGAYPTPPWHHLLGGTTAYITDEWSSSPTKSFRSVSNYGSWIRTDYVDVPELPDQFVYQCTLHMEATPYSSAAVGFPFIDPRFSNQTPIENAVFFTLDGGIRWQGRELREIGSWPQGQDYVCTVRVGIDFIAEKASVWVNGELKGENLAAWPKVIPASSVFGQEVPLNKWGFRLAWNWWTGGGPGRVDIDDVKFEELPESVLMVEIDIKPGSYPNAINLGSHGLIPVAIFSSEDFDANSVDPDTVELAGSDVAVRGKGNKYLAHTEDVDGDDLVDLVVQVATANLDPNSLQDGLAVLTGKTYDGQSIEGQDEITIVPDK